MGYTESLLADGERIERRAHQHWFVMVANERFGVGAVVAAIVLFVLNFVTGVKPNDFIGSLWGFLGYLSLALLVIGLVWLVWGWLHFQNEEYVITSRRIIHAEGVINKKASDSSLEKINDAILTESLFGRMFGFGDLEVLTASESGIENLHMLRNAKDFKKAMLDAKHELEIDLVRPTMPPLRSDAAAPVTPAPVAAVAPAPVHGNDARMSGGDVAEAVQRLAELRDKGLITPEEYEAKKQELLGRL
jgi:Bacterial PH domain/Short C-terminal domain